jgi:DNA-binding transcriptional ArsR family regulator
MSSQDRTTPRSAGHDGSRGEDGSSNPTEQEVFDVLSNRRRRYALYALFRNEASTIGSLADQIAAWENDHCVGDVTPVERKRVYTALQQSHLPKLERTGLVTFDPESGRVRITEAASNLDIYLEVVGDDQLSWDQFYLGLSAVSAAVVVAVWLGVPPFDALPTLSWMALVVTLFGVSAVTQRYRSERMSQGSVPPDVRRRR